MDIKTILRLVQEPRHIFKGLMWRTPHVQPQQAPRARTMTMNITMILVLFLYPHYPRLRGNVLAHRWFSILSKLVRRSNRQYRFKVSKSHRRRLRQIPKFGRRAWEGSLPVPALLP